jgi:hypothetical protein
MKGVGKRVAKIFLRSSPIRHVAARLWHLAVRAVGPFLLFDPCPRRRAKATNSGSFHRRATRAAGHRARRGPSARARLEAGPQGRVGPRHRGPCISGFPHGNHDTAELTQLERGWNPLFLNASEI